MTFSEGTILVGAISVAVLNIIAALFAGFAARDAAKARTDAAAAALAAAVAAANSEAIHQQVEVVKTDLKTVKVQTDGMSKMLEQRSREVGFLEGEKTGISKGIEIQKEIIATNGT